MVRREDQDGDAQNQPQPPQPEPNQHCAQDTGFHQDHTAHVVLDVAMLRAANSHRILRRGRKFGPTTRRSARIDDGDAPRAAVRVLQREHRPAVRVRPADVGEQPEVRHLAWRAPTGRWAPRGWFTPSRRSQCVAASKWRPTCRWSAASISAARVHAFRPRPAHLLRHPYQSGRAATDAEAAAASAVPAPRVGARGGMLAKLGAFSDRLVVEFDQGR